MKLNISKSWLFFLIVLFVYLLVAFFDYSQFLKSSGFIINIFKNIIPIFALVFILMAATNYFLTPERTVKHLGKKSGAKGWLIMIFGGILSTGPIYMWYPLLNDLQKKGVKDGYIATFLYNRAIKIPLMPLFILYFGLKFLVIITFVMIVFSVIQGIVIDIFMEEMK